MPSSSDVPVLLLNQPNISGRAALWPKYTLHNSHRSIVWKRLYCDKASSIVKYADFETSYKFLVKHSGPPAFIAVKAAYEVFDNSPACPSLGATETGVSLPSLPVAMALVKFARWVPFSLNSTQKCTMVLPSAALLFWKKEKPVYKCDQTTINQWLHKRIKVGTHEETSPCHYPLKSLHEGTGRRDWSQGLVPRTVHSKRSEKQVVGTCPKSSNWFEFVGLVHQWPKLFPATRFWSKTASSHDGTCPRDFLQGLVPSCMPALTAL